MGRDVARGLFMWQALPSVIFSFALAASSFPTSSQLHHCPFDENTA